MEEQIIPYSVQIETVAGKCTVSCNMCPIETHPRKEIMSEERFDAILNKLIKIKKHIKFFTLSGIGEPLLDKNTHVKVKKCKQLGFKNVCIYTNATALTNKNSQNLLLSKLDVLVISLDGFKKSQEKIRVGSNYEKIEKNIRDFIQLRNDFFKKTDHFCKVIIRFTEQKINKDEFEKFSKFWLKFLTMGEGESKDLVLKYVVHGHGDLVDISDKVVTKQANSSFIKCPELTKRLSIHSNGRIATCCGDHNEKYTNPSILDSDQDIIDIYNSGNFKMLRETIANKKYVDICKNCTVPFSIESSTVVTK